MGATSTRWLGSHHITSGNILKKILSLFILTCTTALSLNIYKEHCEQYTVNIYIFITRCAVTFIQTDHVRQSQHWLLTVISHTKLLQRTWPFNNQTTVQLVLTRKWIVNTSRSRAVRRKHSTPHGNQYHFPNYKTALTTTVECYNLHNPAHQNYKKGHRQGHEAGN